MQLIVPWKRYLQNAERPILSASILSLQTSIKAIFHSVRQENQNEATFLRTRVRQVHFPRSA